MVFLSKIQLLCLGLLIHSENLKFFQLKNPLKIYLWTVFEVQIKFQKFFKKFFAIKQEKTEGRTPVKKVQQIKKSQL